jgi:hypothetical protein
MRHAGRSEDSYRRIKRARSEDILGRKVSLEHPRPIWLDLDDETDEASKDSEDLRDK